MLLSVQECLERYGSYYAIDQMVSSGRLFKLERGIYSDSSTHAYGEAIVQKKYPKAIFTMESAFFYHDLTDVIPELYSIASPARTWAKTDKRVKQYFVPPQTLEIGVMPFDIHGETIMIYDRERMLIELMRYRNKLSYEYYKEIISNYRNNMDKLYPAKLDDYLEAFPKRDAISRLINAEVF